MIKRAKGIRHAKRESFREESLSDKPRWNPDCLATLAPSPNGQSQGAEAGDIVQAL